MKPYIIDLEDIQTDKGNIVVAEHLPFEVKRVYFLYDTPKGKTRGGHAHKKLHQILVAVAGSFLVTLSDGKGWCQTFFLNRNDEGLYVPPMYWREIQQFSAGAICMALANTYFDPQDYIYEYVQLSQDRDWRQDL